jgi:chromosomal replication initiation ATPase DnaA
MAGGRNSSGGAPGQIPLPFPAAPNYARAALHVSDSNRAALALIDRWPHWPAHAAALYASQGGGKTHLLHIWAARAQALVFSGVTLSEADAIGLAEPAMAAVDDADKAALSASGSRVLFHLLNRAQQEGGYVLLTGQTPPSLWPTPLPDLRTRLAAAAAVGIDPPDDALMAAALTKAFADRQLEATPTLVAYVLARIERSVTAAERFADALDKATLGTGKLLTVEQARRLIAAGAHD